MSYHLGNVSTGDVLLVAKQAEQAAALAKSAQKVAAIEAAKAKAQSEMEAQAKANLVINALLIKNAKVEMSQSGGKLSQVRWDHHANLMRGSRYSGLVQAVKAALDAKIVGILGQRPTEFTRTPVVTLPKAPSAPVVRVPSSPTAPTPGPTTPVVVGPSPDAPPAADVPIAPVTDDQKLDGEGPPMLLIGGVVAVIAFLALRKRG